MLNGPPDGEVAKLVNITNMCQAFNNLPGAGGLLDQDAYLVLGMQKVLSAQNERSELDRKKEQAKSKSGRKGR